MPINGKPESIARERLERWRRKKPKLHSIHRTNSGNVEMLIIPEIQKRWTVCEHHQQSIHSQPSQHNSPEGGVLNREIETVSRLDMEISYPRFGVQLSQGPDIKCVKRESGAEGLGSPSSLSGSLFFPTA